MCYYIMRAICLYVKESQLIVVRLFECLRGLLFEPQQLSICILVKNKNAYWKWNILRSLFECLIQISNNLNKIYQVSFRPVSLWYNLPSSIDFYEQWYRWCIYIFSCAFSLIFMRPLFQATAQFLNFLQWHSKPTKE